MRLGLFWKPEQVAPLADALQHGDVLFPLSQRAYSAGTSVPALNVPQFWEVLRRLDLSLVDDAASKAVGDAIVANNLGACLDKASIWHNAREATYVRLAAKAAIAFYKPEQIIVVGDDPEAIAVQTEAASIGADIIVLPHVPLDVASDPPEPPASLTTPSNGLSSLPGPWVVVLGTAIGDWGRNIPRLAQGGQKLALLLDAKDSGDLPALYTFCAPRENVRLIPLWRETKLRFLERGNNLAFAQHMGRIVDNVLKAKPVLGVVSDLRRAETVVTLSKLNQAGVPALVLAHSGATMAEPYRFHPDELGNAQIEVWTASAALDYGNASVAAPRRIRPALAKRMSRLIRRGAAIHPGLRIGVVVTTAAQFAAPEHDVAELLDSFARLAAGLHSREARITVRLRHFEDCERVWRHAVAGDAKVDFEHSGSRSATTFVRDVDLIVEIGSETTMFLEAAGNFVPYVRMENSSKNGRRFNWDETIVPRLDAVDPWRDLSKLAKSRRRRSMLSVHQHRWLIKETKPQP